MQQTTRALGPLGRSNRLRHIRTAATTAQKKEGTIADAFASLSGQDFAALDPRFAAIKTELIRGNEAAVKASWTRLLVKLQEETQIIKRLGSTVVPQIEYKDIDRPSEHFRAEYLKRGIAVIKGAVPQDEALQMKDELRNYIKANPSTKGEASHTRIS